MHGSQLSAIHSFSLVGKCLEVFLCIFTCAVSTMIPLVYKLECAAILLVSRDGAIRIAVALGCRLLQFVRMCGVFFSGATFPKRAGRSWRQQGHF